MQKKSLPVFAVTENSLSFHIFSFYKSTLRFKVKRKFKVSKLNLDKSLGIAVRVWSSKNIRSFTKL